MIMHSKTFTPLTFFEKLAKSIQSKKAHRKMKQWMKKCIMNGKLAVFSPDSQVIHTAFASN